MDSFTDFVPKLVVPTTREPICIKCRYNMGKPLYGFCEKYKVTPKPSSVQYAKHGKCPCFERATAKKSNQENKENRTDYKKITFGTYGGKPIEWRIVDEDEDSYRLVADKVIESMPFNTEYGDIDWEHSSLRKWLNSEFLDNAFSDKERKRIDSIIYPHLGIIDNVTLLSVEEVKRFFKNNEARRCEATETAVEHGVYVWQRYNCCNWWLKTPGDSLDRVMLVTTSGYIKGDKVTVESDTVGVRPMIAIYK